MTAPRRPTVEIYASVHPGEEAHSAGYAVILCLGNHRKEFSGFRPEKTSLSQASLEAVVDGLERLTTPCRVRFHSASSQTILNLPENFPEMEQEWVDGPPKVPMDEVVGKLRSLVKVHDVELICSPDSPLVLEATEIARQAIRQGTSLSKFFSGEVSCFDPDPQPIESWPDRIAREKAEQLERLKNPWGCRQRPST